ncbi:MAG: nucleotidyltransferase domain-containing protein [bacterium]|nr:nucleotidyltransferase domain-containing protein [bacterium]
MTAIDEAKLVVSKIVMYCKPQKIILFGSIARGAENFESDIDLLIIKKTNKRRPFRVKEVFEAIRGMERNYPLDPIVYTPDEIEKRLKIGDYFVTETMTQGKVMYAN